MSVRTASPFTFHRGGAVTYRGRNIGLVWQWDTGKRKLWACCDPAYFWHGTRFHTREAAAERLRKVA
jgi:hypothetical protein